jgi:hypothetical protein
MQVKLTCVARRMGLVHTPLKKRAKNVAFCGNEPNQFGAAQGGFLKNRAV